MRIIVVIYKAHSSVITSLVAIYRLLYLFSTLLNFYSQIHSGVTERNTNLPMVLWLLHNMTTNISFQGASPELCFVFHIY